MDYNKAIKEAYDELEQVSGDEHLIFMAELKIKGLRDEQAAIAYAEEHGFDRGKKEGVEQGIEQGSRQEKLEIAKKMIKENVDTNLISKVTELSQEEIEKLKKEII